jgi:hypothetical protein
MAVIRQLPGPPCQRCGTSINLPHATPLDCADALKLELSSLLGEVRRLTGRSAELTAERLEEIRTMVVTIRARNRAAR